MFFLHWFRKRTFGNKWHTFVLAGCPSHHPTNSGNALKKVVLSASKEAQSTDPKHWPALILSLTTTGLHHASSPMPVPSLSSGQYGYWLLFSYNLQVAQLSQRDCATHELLPFAKLQSGILEPPFFGGLRRNADASYIRRWKKRGRLPIGDNWTF